MYNPKEKILSLAIAFILVFFFIYGIDVFYSAPSREDYCTDKIYERIIINQTDCVLMGGKWNTYGGLAKPLPIENETNGWCIPSYKCDQNYNLARTAYYRVFFIVMIFLGTLCLVVGAIMKIESIGVGIMISGLITTIYGFIRSWKFLSDSGKVIALIPLMLLSLVALFWIGTKKLNPKKKK